MKWDKRITDVEIVQRSFLTVKYKLRLALSKYHSVFLLPRFLSLFLS
jgi:hypothetical protein